MEDVHSYCLRKKIGSKDLARCKPHQPLGEPYVPKLQRKTPNGHHISDSPTHQDNVNYGNKLVPICEKSRCHFSITSKDPLPEGQLEGGPKTEKLSFFHEK